MYAYPIYPERNTVSLDGFWDFAFLGDVPMTDLATEKIVYNDIMSVPGCFDATPNYAALRGAAVYRRQVNVPSMGRYRLILHGLGLAGKVFCNGKEIFYTKCAWSQQSVIFEVPSTAFELVIAVDNRIAPEKAATILFHPNYDFYGYGGIYRSVELERLPDEGNFDRVRIETLDLKGTVRLSGHYCGKADSLQLSFDGGAFTELAKDFPGGDFSFTAVVPKPDLWSPETPVLHTAALKTGADEIIEQFGLRTIQVSGNKILLNGEPLRLVGYNRHDMSPQSGAAVPDTVWIEDLQLLKDMNCNFIRGSHYPQSQRFLDLCDRMGFLVWEESLGWGNRKAVVTNEEFIQLQLEQTENMIHVSGNHPSVIMWAFTNEINDCEESGDKLVRLLAEKVRSCDKSRPVTMASMYIKTSLSIDALDIIGINTYPGWYEGSNPDDPHPLWRIKQELDETLRIIESKGFGGKPMIISEIGAAAMYGWHDRSRSIWSEEYQMDLLSEMCEYFKSHPCLNGLAFWLFADVKSFNATTGVLERPRTFNNKGTLDEHRRPKLAYDKIKQEFAEILNRK